MEPLIFHIDDRLDEVGSSLPYAGHIEQDSYNLGDHEFSLPKGIDYDLVITNTGEGFLVTGMLRALALGTCDRCLEEAELRIHGEVDGYYLFEEPDDERDDDSDIDYYLVYEDTIDLSGALLTALIMETPFVVLCKPDCKGLCPSCGANLNEGDCGCRKVSQNRTFAGPFAKLADLKLSSEEP